MWPLLVECGVGAGFLCGPFWESAAGGGVWEGGMVSVAAHVAGHEGGVSEGRHKGGGEAASVSGRQAAAAVVCPVQHPRLSMRPRVPGSAATEAASKGGVVVRESAFGIVII